jgi:methylated-DNA-protein-cysteine methyltransferase related protein
MTATRFTSPPDPQKFRINVWNIVRKIPAGKVATYGQIAALLPTSPEMSAQNFRAFAPRWVGGAMANCPDDVPWQRVINAQGKISLKGRDKFHQQELLEAEGVEFDQHQCVDLKRFGWNSSS